jgi:hypothetical protein
MWKRLEAERQQLFRGMGVLDVCRLACESMPTEARPESFEDALQIAYDIIAWATGEIGMIANDAEEQARTIVQAAEGAEASKD